MIHKLLMCDEVPKGDSDTERTMVLRRRKKLYLILKTLQMLGRFDGKLDGVETLLSIINSLPSLDLEYKFRLSVEAYIKTVGTALADGYDAESMFNVNTIFEWIEGEFPEREESNEYDETMMASLGFTVLDMVIFNTSYGSYERLAMYRSDRYRRTFVDIWNRCYRDRDWNVVKDEDLHPMDRSTWNRKNIYYHLCAGIFLHDEKYIHNARMLTSSVYERANLFMGESWDPTNLSRIIAQLLINPIYRQSAMEGKLNHCQHYVVGDPKGRYATLSLGSNGRFLLSTGENIGGSIVKMHKDYPNKIVLFERTEVEVDDKPVDLLVLPDDLDRDILRQYIDEDIRELADPRISILDEWYKRRVRDNDTIYSFEDS